MSSDGENKTPDCPQPNAVDVSTPDGKVGPITFHGYPSIDRKTFEECLANAPSLLSPDPAKRREFQEIARKAHQEYLAARTLAEREGQTIH